MLRTAATLGGSPKEEVASMLFRLRCDHCEAVLGEGHLERDRKRFCCADCARAFDRGETKAISPHIHEEASTRVEVGGRR